MVDRHIGGILYGIEHDLDRVGVMQKFDNERPIDGVNSIKDGQPPNIISVLEAKIRHEALPAIRRYTSKALSLRNILRDPVAAL